ncbi:MAG: M20/M25/M40 family metallo-hydrolase, partial [Burkholderia ambifaria]
GTMCEVTYTRYYPATVNSDAEVALALAAAEAAGLQAEVAPRPAFTSEDFAFMLQQRPGSFVRLGNGEGEDGCMVHNPKYDFNDRNLPIGAAFWTRLVERYLGQ